MPDMGSFIRIDVGVLDDDFPAGARRLTLFAAQQRRAIRAAIEADIDVAVAGHFHRRHPGNLTDRLHQLFGNLLRRLFQALRQLKRDRDRYFAKRPLPRLFQRKSGIDAELRPQTVAKRRVNGFLQGMKHGNLSVPLAVEAAGSFAAVIIRCRSEPSPSGSGNVNSRITF